MPLFVWYVKKYPRALLVGEDKGHTVVRGGRRNGVYARCALNEVQATIHTLADAEIDPLHLGKGFTHIVRFLFEGVCCTEIRLKFHKNILAFPQELVEGL